MTGNQMPLACVWLRGKFHVERCQEDGTRQTVANGEWAGSYARVLLKRLLCAPSRRAMRSDLIDELWPGEHENADQYLSIASSRLRHIFQNKKIITRVADGYELATPEVLWCDIEECERLMLEAERLMRDLNQMSWHCGEPFMWWIWHKSMLAKVKWNLRATVPSRSLL